MNTNPKKVTVSLSGLVAGTEESARATVECAHCAPAENLAKEVAKPRKKLLWWAAGAAVVSLGAFMLSKRSIGPENDTVRSR